MAGRWLSIDLSGSRFFERIDGGRDARRYSSIFIRQVFLKILSSKSAS